MEILLTAIITSAVFILIITVLAGLASKNKDEAIKGMTAAHNNTIQGIIKDNGDRIESMRRIHEDRYQSMLKDQENKFNDLHRKFKKLNSSYKSQQVRMGHVMEKIAPVLDTFPFDITDSDIIPIFGAVDYLAIRTDDKDDEKNGVYLIEIKSGGATLSSKQRKIKKLVEEGKVDFLMYKGDKVDDDTDGEEDGKEEHPE